MRKDRIEMRKDFMAGAIVLPGFIPERKHAEEVKVWKDRGKLFVRVPVEGDHPQQVEIDIINKTYDVYGHD